MPLEKKLYGRTIVRTRRKKYFFLVRFREPIFEGSQIVWVSVAPEELRRELVARFVDPNSVP